MKKDRLSYLIILSVLVLLVCSSAILSAENSNTSPLDEAMLSLDITKLQGEIEKLKSSNSPENLAALGKIYFRIAEYYELKSSNNKGSEWDESQENLDMAIETLRKAVNSGNADYNTHYIFIKSLIYRIRHYGGLFDLYQIITTGQEATKVIEALNKLEPNNPVNIVAKGIQTLYKPENMEGGILNAVPNMEKTLASAPDNPEILYWLGRAYSLNGAKGRDVKKAKDFLQKAIAVNPNDSRYKLELDKIKE